MSARGVPGDTVEASRHQHHPKLPATRQRFLKAQTADVLAVGHVRVFGDQGSGLGRDERSHIGLLGIRPKAALCCAAKRLLHIIDAALIVLI